VRAARTHSVQGRQVLELDSLRVARRGKRVRDFARITEEAAGEREAVEDQDLMIEALDADRELPLGQRFPPP
jgi:hypothetical protein